MCPWERPDKKEERETVAETVEDKIAKLIADSSPTRVASLDELDVPDEVVVPDELVANSKFCLPSNQHK